MSFKSLKVHDDVHKAVKIEAAKAGLSVTEFIKMLLEKLK